MMCFDLDIHYMMADSHLQQIREYSPATYTVLEKVRRYGSQAAFQIAFTITCYKSELARKKEIPTQFDYYYLIRDFPQVVGLLDEAINCLLEDWLCGNLKTADARIF